MSLYTNVAAFVALVAVFHLFLTEDLARVLLYESILPQDLPIPIKSCGRFVSKGGSLIETNESNDCHFNTSVTEKGGKLIILNLAYPQESCNSNIGICPHFRVHVEGGALLWSYSLPEIRSITVNCCAIVRDVDRMGRPLTNETTAAFHDDWCLAQGEYYAMNLTCHGSVTLKKDDTQHHASTTTTSMCMEVDKAKQTPCVGWQVDFTLRTTNEVRTLSIALALVLVGLGYAWYWGYL